MDTARSYVGTLGTNVVAGALGTPSAIAHGLDWVGHKAGQDWGLQGKLHSIPDPSHPEQPLFPTPGEAHEMAYNTMGVLEYVPESTTGRVVQTGLEGVLGGGAGSLATAPLRMMGRAGMSGAVRGTLGAATVGGVGAASGQAAYEGAPEGYKEGAALAGGLLGGGLASAGRGLGPRPRSRLGPGGRGTASTTPTVQPPVVPDAAPPPSVTMQGAENPRPPPAGLPTAYGPATGNVPASAVTGSSRLFTAPGAAGATGEVVTGQELALARAAQGVSARASAAEPALTQAIQGTTEQLGGQMLGLENRLKTADSLKRKIANDAQALSVSPEKAAGRIADAVRYTASFEPDKLVAGVEAVLARLQQEGSVVVKLKNTWLDPSSSYKGINVQLRSPSGEPFELQFHTPGSFRAKEMETHAIYERMRLLERGSDEWNRLNEEQLAVARRLEVPKDIERIRPAGG